MKLGMLPTTIGGIITVFGIIFHFQGQSVIGPESSFMYSNPDWTTYGLQIIVIGIIITVSGIGWAVIKRN